MSNQRPQAAWPRLSDYATLHIPVPPNQYVEFIITHDGLLTAGANGKMSGPFVQKGVKAVWKNVIHSCNAVEDGTYCIPDHAPCTLVVIIKGRVRLYVFTADPADPAAPDPLRSSVFGMSRLLPRFSARL